MAEEIKVNIHLDKEEKYKALLPQIEALVQGEKNLIANLANITAALNQTFRFFWIGFYLVENRELVLGPFQGPVACTRIAYGKGVCGTAWQENRTILVLDVTQFPGHIACNAAAKSEIVVPCSNSKNQVTLILDIDSDTLNAFNETDQKYLEEIVGLITTE